MPKFQLVCHAQSLSISLAEACTLLSCLLQIPQLGAELAEKFHRQQPVRPKQFFYRESVPPRWPVTQGGLDSIVSQ